MRGIRLLPEDASYDDLGSPVGVLTIIASSQGLHAIIWDNDVINPCYQHAMSLLKKSSSEKTTVDTKTQLDEYFQGKRKRFSLPLAISGTAFQMQVWAELLKIPYAETISYGEQAMKMGDKKKARAVGMANGRNPISIVIPCHRVIGSNGHLVGFGGGLDKKAILLELEQKGRSKTR